MDSSSLYESPALNSSHSGTTSTRSYKSSKTTPSFFDRMSKHDTYASSGMKNGIEAPLTKQSSTKRSSKKVNPSFFDRMAKHETYASSTTRKAYRDEEDERNSPSNQSKSYKPKSS